MFKYLLSVFYVFLSILFFSCEKKIDNNFASLEPKLVLNCLMDTSELFEVQLSSTSAMTDTSNVLVSFAKVEIWESNQLLEQLPYAGNGIYKSTINKPRSDFTYRVEASAPGFETVTATDTIPFPVKIQNGTVIVPATTDLAGDPILEFTVEFNDPPENNYYEIIFLSKQVHEDITWEIDTVILGDTTWFIDRWRYIDSDDPIIKAEGDLDYYPNTAYFSDQLFNGQNVSISIKILQANNIENNYFLQEDFETIAMLRTISYSYYQYRKKWTRHSYNQGIDLDIQDSDEFRAFLFTGEPVNMYTNVENGFGIFAGFSKSQIILRREKKK